MGTSRCPTLGAGPDSVIKARGRQSRSRIFRNRARRLGRGEAGDRVPVGGHALPVHDVVLLLQRLLRIRRAIRVVDDPEGAARGRANRRPFAGVACGRADPGTQPRSERSTQ